MRPAAGAAESLSVKERCLTAPELSSQKLVLGHIDGASDVLLQRMVFDDRSPDEADVPNLTIGSHDALGGIKARRFRKDSRDQLCRELAILRVHALQVFLNCRRFAGKLEAVHPKEFGRPVVEPGRLKGPAAHVGKALPFGEIGLASLQLLGASAELFFGTFVILDV